jgi:hypothetical protein
MSGLLKIEFQNDSNSDACEMGDEQCAQRDDKLRVTPVVTICKEFRDKKPANHVSVRNSIGPSDAPRITEEIDATDLETASRSSRDGP